MDTMARALLLLPLGLSLAACGASSSGGPAPPSGTDASSSSAAPGCPPVSFAGSMDDLVHAVVAAMAAKAGAGSNALVLPSAAERDAFAEATLAALSGDAQQACNLPASYRTFSLRDGTDDVLVVAELEASGAPAPSKFWGTYAARRPSQGTRAIVVEAPHPLFDANTPYESRAVFSAARAEWFLMAGAHRCANSKSSACSGTTTACGGNAPYRDSDAAHETGTPFYAVHAALSAANTDPFIQLHGNAQSCPDALVSDSSGAYSAGSAAAKLAAAIESRGPSVGRCGAGYPTSSCNLCGTDNVEARMTAGAPDACTAMGTSYARFVHIEQQPGLRQIPSGTSRGYQPVVDAVVATFPAR